MLDETLHSLGSSPLHSHCPPQGLMLKSRWCCSSAGLIHPSIPAGFGAHGSQGSPSSEGSCWKLQEGAVGALQSPVGCRIWAGRGRSRSSSREPGSWVSSGSLPPLPRLLSCSWSFEAPASVGFFFFFPLLFFFLSSGLGKSELEWELSHCEWERGDSCTNLGLSGRLRKQKTTPMFHHSPNYNGVKFGTSAVKTSFQSPQAGIPLQEPWEGGLVTESAAPDYAVSKCVIEINHFFPHAQKYLSCLERSSPSRTT